MSNHTSDLTKDELELLCSWEEVFKKGTLTLRVLVALRDKQHDAASLYIKLGHQVNGEQINEHSLYRLLRRLYEANLIDLISIIGKSKYYGLSPSGDRLLTSFIARNEISLKLFIKEL